MGAEEGCPIGHSRLVWRLSLALALSARRWERDIGDRENGVLKTIYDQGESPRLLLDNFIAVSY